MGGRRSQQPAISLFSFQDIVTSVTAILILIVLIMSLELITRKFTQAAGDVEATVVAIDQSVAEMEVLVNRLRAKVASDASVPAAGAALSRSDRDVRILRDQVERAAGQVADAQRVRDAARRMADAAAAELRHKESMAVEMLEQERHADEVAAEAEQLAAKNAEERSRLDAQLRDLKKRGGNTMDLVFRRPEDPSRQSWLLEVSEQGCVAVRLGSGQPEPLGASTGAGTPFASWFERLRSGGDYVLVLIRPSGIDAVGDVLRQLSERDVPHGKEFIGEEQPVHDGAAPAGQSSRATGSD